MAGTDLANQEVEIYKVTATCNIELIGKGKVDDDGKFDVRIAKSGIRTNQMIVVRIERDVVCAWAR